MRQNGGVVNSTAGNTHERDYGYRVGVGKACLPGSRSRSCRWAGIAKAASAQTGAGVLCQSVTVFERHGGLCWIALLGTRAAGSGPRGAADLAVIRQALCQDEQE